MRGESLSGRGPIYGATNQAFISDDVLTGHRKRAPSLLEIFEGPQQKLPSVEAIPEDEDDIVVDDAQNEGDGRESWDSKITFLLATIGYAGNVEKYENYSCGNFT